MSLNHKTVEGCQPSHAGTVRLPTAEWRIANAATWYPLFKELELKKDRGDRFDNQMIWVYPDTAAMGIAILVAADVITRSEGEAFLEHWRAGDEEVLLPDNSWIMLTGLIKRTDRRDAEEVITHVTFEEVEAWRLCGKAAQV